MKTLSITWLLVSLCLYHIHKYSLYKSIIMYKIFLVGQKLVLYSYKFSKPGKENDSTSTLP